ncbi:hypothetical protein ASD03_31830 [Ensifer sp. Root127]|nr:hypothetical protein ASD03_31830 [Ensifer sp. Root127]
MPSPALQAADFLFADRSLTLPGKPFTFPHDALKLADGLGRQQVDDLNFDGRDEIHKALNQIRRQKC